VGGVEADVEAAGGGAGNDVAGGVADVDGGQFEVRRREGRIALVQHPAGEAVQQVDQHRDRIGRPLRIGDVALAAAHGDPDVERAATADLDGVAQPDLRRRFADDAG